MQLSEAVEERFWSFVIPGPGCWEWQGHLTKKKDRPDELPYGEFSIDGKKYRAHRIAWMLERGPIEAGLFVCHSCDNPPCVRFGHLFLGDAEANFKDSVSKGRQKQVRLTPELVVEIRERRAAGEFLKVLATEFGISEPMVHHIVRGRTWKSAGGPIDDRDWRGMAMQYIDTRQKRRKK